jgi:hypothetical protein
MESNLPLYQVYELSDQGGSVAATRADASPSQPMLLRGTELKITQTSGDSKH